MVLIENGREMDDTLDRTGNSVKYSSCSETFNKLSIVQTVEMSGKM